MGEEETYSINDTNRTIARIIESLKAFESPLADKRVQAIIITKLEEAQLWSLKLIIKASLERRGE